MKRKSYSYDKQYGETIEWHVSKMLKERIIDRSNSPYYSPALLYRKQNGKPAVSPEAWGLAIDHRKLNKQTIILNYPMPRIYESLHGVKSHKISSTLDLTSGYQ